MPRFTEHNPVALCQPRRCMTRRIALHVSLGFNNRSATRTIWRVANEKMPQQLRRNDAGRRLVKRTGQCGKGFHSRAKKFNRTRCKVEFSCKITIRIPCRVFHEFEIELMEHGRRNFVPTSIQLRDFPVTFNASKISRHQRLCFFIPILLLLIFCLASDFFTSDLRCFFASHWNLVSVEHTTVKFQLLTFHTSERVHVPMDVSFF